MVDSGLPDYVKKWNEKYAYPKLVIASAATIADAFEQRFGSIIPEHRGDLTEYWTDGLGSDARRVGYNRVAKENLVQAETLWTMLRRNEAFPQAEFYDAWRWIQLGSEHTWGYMDPAHPIAKKIEATKASYFENAAKAGKELLAKSVQPIVKPGSDTIAVLNTLSWIRTDLVVLTKEQSKAGDGVATDDKSPIPSQRLSTGELVFLAGQIPAFGSRVFRMRPEVVVRESWPVAKAVGHILENSLVKVTLNPKTGDITANLLGAVPLHAWSKKPGDTRTIVSWALNNHWHTNFPLEHLVRYYGWYSNKSRGQRAQRQPAASAAAAAPARSPTAREARKGWAALIKQVYEADPLCCPKCGAEMKIIAFIERRQTEVIEKILRHCGWWEEQPARGPPEGEPLLSTA